jgi:hypothetical protein
MATAAPAATDCRVRTVLAAALSRTTAAFLFLSVVAVGVVVSGRWITATTAVSPRSPIPSCRVTIDASFLLRCCCLIPHDRENLPLFYIYWTY